MEQAKTSREAEVQRIVGQWQAELAQMDTQNQAEMEAQAERHRAEVGRVVAEWQERSAEAEAALEPLKAKLEDAHDRLRSLRNRHKEEVTRIEVELKSKISRAEEHLRDAEEQSAKLRAQQQMPVPAAPPRRDLASLLPQRPLQTARLAKLWVEHALDRDDN
jgi:chromosome segregation ATPase